MKAGYVTLVAAGQLLQVRMPGDLHALVLSRFGLSS